MKISKKERREAVEQLEQFADTWIDGLTVNNRVYHGDAALCDLAYKAQNAICKNARGLFNFHDIGNSVVMAHVYLEAAALLRSGWNPGEPLEAL